MVDDQFAKLATERSSGFESPSLRHFLERGTYHGRNGRFWSTSL